MIDVFHTSSRRAPAWRRIGLTAAIVAAMLPGMWALAPARPAAAADPAVVFMARVGKELMAAARTFSPSVMANVIQKYGDVRWIGDVSLGSYRTKLAEADREAYYAGMIRFIASYGARASQKIRVTRVEWASHALKGSSGVMVDCTVSLSDGTSWDVRWVLRPVGGTYKVRDAEVLGQRMTSYLTDAFEDYIAQNGGRTRALVTALNR